MKRGESFIESDKRRASPDPEVDEFPEKLADAVLIFQIENLPHEIKAQTILLPYQVESVEVEDEEVMPHEIEQSLIGAQAGKVYPEEPVGNLQNRERTDRKFLQTCLPDCPDNFLSCSDMSEDSGGADA